MRRLPKMLVSKKDTPVKCYVGYKVNVNPLPALCHNLKYYQMTNKAFVCIAKQLQKIDAFLQIQYMKAWKPSLFAPPFLWAIGVVGYE